MLALSGAHLRRRCIAGGRSRPKSRAAGTGRLRPIPEAGESFSPPISGSESSASDMGRRPRDALCIGRAP
eukprot:scaffold198445_cov27-Tisochrysis_lutea.AAC.2